MVTLAVNLVAGVFGDGVAGSEAAEGAEEVADGGTAGGEEGGDSQEGEAEKGRLGERRSEEEEGTQGSGEQADVLLGSTTGLARLVGLTAADFTAFALGQMLELLR